MKFLPVHFCTVVLHNQTSCSSFQMKPFKIFLWSFEPVSKEQIVVTLTVTLTYPFC